MKKKKWLGLAVQVLVGAGIGFCGGFFLGKFLIGGLEKGNLSVWTLILMLELLIVTYYLQIIIHEGGHLIFGLLTGYEFVSFRVFSRVLVKENGKCHIKRYSIPGTGGQCLLYYPEEIDNYPYQLYNYGGSILNIVTALLCLGLYFVLPKTQLGSVFMIGNAVIGIFFGLMNGLPLELSGISNDGKNVQLMKKDVNARRALWLQLRINALLTEGIRYKDMPAEWFALPEGADIGNPLYTYMVGAFCARRMEEGQFTEALLQLREALESKKIQGLYYQELAGELLYLELVEAKDMERVKALYTKQQAKYIKACKHMLSKRRIMYAYYRILEKDTEKANKEYKAFEKLEKTYPILGEAAMEREFLDYVQ